MTLLLLLMWLADGPPYYTNPVNPTEYLARLRQEIASGKIASEAWRLKLQLYTNLGELQTIPELIDLLAQTFPQEPAFQESRMILLSLAKKHTEAVELGQQILEKFPNYPTIRVNLARAHFNAGQRAQGINRMFEAMLLGPIRVEDWDILIKNLTQGASPETIIATLKTKIEKNPQLPGLKYTLMVLLTRLGRYTEARDILKANPELAAHPDLQIFVSQDIGH